MEERTPDPSIPIRVRDNRRRHLVWIATLFLAVGASSIGTTSCESTESSRSQIVAMINRSRATAGLAPVQRNVELDVKADSWAQHLRDVCSLSHSVLSDGAPSTWYRIGENVGSGGGIVQVHRGFMHSPGHRSNILDPAYTAVGTAAVSGDCDGYRKVFVVTVFMEEERP